MKKVFLTLLLLLVTNSCECRNTSNNETNLPEISGNLGQCKCNWSQSLGGTPYP